MSVYFIHAEVVLSNGCVAEKVGLIVMINSIISSIRFTQNVGDWCLETGWKMLYSITVML